MAEDRPGNRAPGDELVEVVDDDGRVIDVVTRAEVRAGRLRHRCTYVGVATSAGELVVHQRAGWKDVYPGWWDLCFGGIVGVGEDWDSSALRELAEEAGITGEPLTDLGPITWEREGEGGRIVGRVYAVRYDGPLTCPDGEVAVLDRVPFDELDAWLDGRQVCPDSHDAALPLLRDYLLRLVAG